MSKKTLRKVVVNIALFPFLILGGIAMGYLLLRLGIFFEGE